MGSLEPPLTKNIFVRSAQWNAARQEPERAVHVVRGFVRGKLKNYRMALLRANRLAVSAVSAGPAVAVGLTIPCRE